MGDLLPHLVLFLVTALNLDNSFSLVRRRNIEAEKQRVDLVLCVLSRLKKCSVGRLHKVLYRIDRELAKKCRREMLFIWKFTEYGPRSRDLDELIQELAKQGVLRVYRWRGVLYVKAHDLAEHIMLDQTVLGVVDAVLATCFRQIRQSRPGGPAGQGQDLGNRQANGSARE